MLEPDPSIQQGHDTLSNGHIHTQELGPLHHGAGAIDALRHMTQGVHGLLQRLALRQRQATLMGCANYADFKLADTMAQTRARVWTLLDEVWGRALPALASERAMLREAMAGAGVEHELQPWDWRFWAEQVLALDAINPEIAARLARAFDHWARFIPSVQAQMRVQLQRVATHKGLSRNTLEIVSKALAL